MPTFREIDLKLGNMRKAQSFLMYPNDPSADRARLQSDNRCLIVDLTSGKGLLSKSVANYPRFEHCAPAVGGMFVDVGAEVLSRLQTMSAQGSGSEVQVTGAGVSAASY